MNNRIRLKNSLIKQNRYQSVCFYCERKIKPKNLTLDHFIPRSLGGKHLVLCCRECNTFKAAHSPIVFVGKLETVKRNVEKLLLEVNI